MNNKKVKSVIKEFESDYYKLQEELKKRYNESDTGETDSQEA